MQLICIRLEIHIFYFLGIRLLHVSFTLNKDVLAYNLSKMLENTFFAKTSTPFI